MPRRLTCSTSRMLFLSHLMLRFRISTPSKVIEPLSTEYHLSMRPKMVLFPDPLAPTRAVVFFAGMFRLRPVKTAAFRRVGYEKWTSFNPMAPDISFGLTPSSDSESISDLRSMTWKRAWAAAPALEICIT